MTDESGIRRRLTELKQEHDKGQQMLVELQQQEAELQQKLLRISGAIQVLEELIADSADSDESSADD